MHQVEKSVKQTTGPYVLAIDQKLNKVFKRNPGWTIMERIGDILEGKTKTLRKRKY